MRSDADEALKSIVVSDLRARGFNGSYPNFYRDRNGHIDLLTFQFNNKGGSFVCEISFADQERSNVYIYKETEPKMLRPNQTTLRLRLGAQPDQGIEDHWFSFENTGLVSRNSPTKAAQEVLSLVESQAEPWWRVQETTTANKAAGHQRLISCEPKPT